MPPQFIIDIAGLDLDHVLHTQEDIRQYNPQRGSMEMLNAITYASHEKGEIIGYKDVRADEFWVEGHIPGRPLFPGVLMIESGAQIASFFTKRYTGWTGFVGFGGVTDVKFRQQVVPGQRMYVLGKKIWERHHRIQCLIQGIVEGNLAFEATIVGVEF